MTDHGYDLARRAIEASLRRLQLDYLGLYLLHWPVPNDFDATVAAYKAAEAASDDGHVRAVGVSNFKPEHVEALMSRVEVIPAVNPVELHPYFTQPDVRKFDTRSRGRRAAAAGYTAPTGIR